MTVSSRSSTASCALPDGSRLLVLGPLIRDRKTEGDRVFEARPQAGLRARPRRRRAGATSTRRRRSTSTSATPSRSWSTGSSSATPTTTAGRSARTTRTRMPRGWRTRSRPRCGWARGSWSSRPPTRAPSRSSASASATAARSTAPRSTSSSRAPSRSTRRTAPARRAPAWACAWSSTPIALIPNQRLLDRGRRAACRGRAMPTRLRGTARSPRPWPSAHGFGTRRARRQAAAGGARLPALRAAGREGRASATATHGGSATLRRRRSRALITNLERRYRETDSEYVKTELEKFMVERPCPTCGGQAPQAGGARRHHRRPEHLGRRGAGGHRRARLGGARCRSVLTERERAIARQVLKEIRARLGFLVDVGLDYLTLDRTSSTLSGGEAQRIRLATQIGSSLVGVLYILDEPTIGLHQKDNAKLIATLVRLRDLGNTLHRRRARRGDHPDGRLGRRHRAGGRRARRRGHRQRAAARRCSRSRGRSPAPTCAASGRCPIPTQAAQGQRQGARRARRARSTTSRTSTCASRWARSRR